MPTTLQHPCLLPADLRAGYAVVLKRDGPNQGLVKSAIRQGVFLKVDALHQLHLIYGFKTLPKKGQGSGQKGSLLKIDYARATVEHFFGSESKEEQEKMVQALMGKHWKHLKVACPQEVLDAFNSLPHDDQRSFGPISFLGKDQADLKKRAAEQEPRTVSTKVHFTPADFKAIMPDVQGSYLSRHP